ncbi:MAG: L,D-transpeptidase family protein [Sphingomonas sp.]|uniref:L,D-transpeptidase family protein n=1 Tax=Sphingomonas sp. TaxID=28214 RepID=UPI00179F391C|nr:L,D-transpeptidase family protein [Sphingomonas sp.]MBA3666696.1 L,D-transpeptidase family protein [Sphingomonas sp.]
MNKLVLALAAGAFALSAPLTPAIASVETEEARTAALDAAELARQDMIATFGDKQLKPGQYLWDADAPASGPVRVVISLADQMAYLYRGGTLVAVSTISSGKSGNDTPTGIFPILAKKPIYHSRKYDNAPMPFMQQIDEYGIALHAGMNPGYPASHGCVRLPAKFAAKLYGVTELGSEVLIAS